MYFFIYFILFLKYTFLLHHPTNTVQEQVFHLAEVAYFFSYLFYQIAASGKSLLGG
jgi:hypothetical protein